MHNYPNPNDIDTGLLMLAAVVVLFIALGVWLENWMEMRTVRKLEEAGKRARDSYGYRQIWMVREERFWSKLRHSSHLEIMRSLTHHAETLAAIRCHQTRRRRDGHRRRAQGNQGQNAVPIA
jgi:hypothetical protein